jgi:hypothetical protein
MGLRSFFDVWARQDVTKLTRRHERVQDFDHVGESALPDDDQVLALEIPTDQTTRR